MPLTSAVSHQGPLSQPPPVGVNSKPALSPGLSRRALFPGTALTLLIATQAEAVGLPVTSMLRINKSLQRIEFPVGPQELGTARVKQSAVPCTPGMYCLLPPVKTGPGVDLVAVHGLQLQDTGSAWAETWVDKAGRCWLTDDLPGALNVPGCSPEQYNVFSLSVSGASSFTTFRDAAQDACSDLLPRGPDMPSTGSQNGYEGVSAAGRISMYISYGLGEFVIKEVLSQQARQAASTLSLSPQASQQIMTHCAGLVFLGTPHLGALTASILRNFIPTPSDFGDLLPTASPKGRRLIALGKRFDELAGRFAIPSFALCEATKIQGLGVSERSTSAHEHPPEFANITGDSFQKQQQLLAADQQGSAAAEVAPDGPLADCVLVQNDAQVHLQLGGQRIYLASGQSSLKEQDSEANPPALGTASLLLSQLKGLESQRIMLAQGHFSRNTILGLHSDSGYTIVQAATPEQLRKLGVPWLHVHASKAAFLLPPDLKLEEHEAFIEVGNKANSWSAPLLVPIKPVDSLSYQEADLSRSQRETLHSVVLPWLELEEYAYPDTDSPA
ncbi:hypothetical protein WJX73_001500 [Symbiochloris irregularis]|uniref:DUF676 domain-containing protein n=1 Tax=Symbiochloris irregularis TaxID=706552 RepID=A0AAW1PBX9_9CHLO